MKQYLLNICILFVCISGTLLLPNRSYGQLNGAYTINPTKAASSSNYQNWASAVGDLISGSRTDGGTAQGSGVSGPVTITVYDTLYNNTNVAITAISGASYSNTITFKSAKGDSSKCRLRYASSTSSTDDYVLMLDGADYVTFRQIGFERTGTNTYSTVVQITNDADNNKLIRCLLKARKMPSSSSLGFNYGIGSCIYFTGNGDSSQIIQNRLLYGYNGIYCANSCTANNISGNLIDTSGSAGMYMTGQTSLRITGNTCNMGDFGTNQGHYTSYGMRIETSPSLNISNNKIFMLANNGQVVRAMIIASITSTASAPGMVYNNWIMNSGGTGNCTGLAVYACNYLNFHFNNVLILNSLADGSAYYHYPQYSNTYIKLLNNNFINKGGGYAYNVSGTNTGDLDSVNFNNAYTTGSYLGIWSGTNYSSLSAWQTASGKDANSLSTDPGFSGNTNLHVSNIGLNGKALPYYGIATDIDGENRDASVPDIGADEFFPIANDAGISNIDSPLLFCAGAQAVKVRFQNYGFDTIKSVNIQWQINGVAQTAFNWTGKVAPGGSSASLNLGNYTFVSNTAYKFDIWTKNPNSLTDGKNINDTLHLTRFAGMSGSYTIGDTNIANYKSFNDAINAMTSRGICGAIKFNVYKGIYKEQITLVQLPGMKASNPVTFENIDKDSTTVVITLPSTIATGNNNAALQLRGADYVTFRHITFERTGVTTNYGQVIHILNGSNNNTFSNCRMLGLPLTSANANAMNIWSDQSRDNNNTFINNAIRYGNYNMYYSGTTASHESGTVIENNTFDGAYNNSIQISYNDKVNLKGNTFLNVTSALSGNYDVMLNYCDSNISIIENYFKSSNTSNSILVNACKAPTSSTSTIANNSISKGTGTGISLDSTTNMNIVFNSVNFATNLSTNAAISTNGNSSNLVLLNNNIVMSGGEVLHIQSASEVSASNYNNLYAKGTEFAYWGGASHTSLSSLVSASGKDVQSLSIDPLFISSSNLHIINPDMKGRGIAVTGISADIDGESRNATAPDIGADEFKLVPNDAGIVGLTKPAANACSGTLAVEAVIKNTGGDTLKNSTVNWSVNGIPQTPFSWTGSLPTNAKDTFVVGNFNFTGITNPKFIIKTSLPNGQSDGIPFNDSIIVNRFVRALPVANAGADDTICMGDQILIGPTNNNSFNYRWTSLFNTVIDSVSQIYVKPSIKSSYVLEVINKTYGCAKKDTIVIHVNSKPVAEAGPDLNICLGSSAQIGKAPQSGFTYAWTSQPPGFNSTTANPIVTPTTSTTYALKKTSTTTGCQATDTAKITINLPPTPVITGNSKACNGNTMTYTTSLNVGNTYKWTVTGGQILSGANSYNPSIRWNVSGTGSIKVTETNPKTCKDSSLYSVTVSANPIANFNISGTCKGVSINFTNTSTDGQTSEWTFGDGGSSTQTNPSHIYSTVSAFPIKLIVKNNAACPDTTTQLISIKPLPVAGFSATKTANRVLTFSDTSKIPTGVISEWLWEFGDGDTSTIQNPSHLFGTEGTFIVKLCVKSSFGCENCTTTNYNILKESTSTKVNKLLALPNPGSGLFKLQSSLPADRVIVSDLLGKIIMETTPSEQTFTIDLTAQSNGIYFIRVISGNTTGIIKLIKQ